jgi:hypothetical protein
MENGKWKMENETPERSCRTYTEDRTTPERKMVG